VISSKPFALAHITHPDWNMATELVCAQLEGFSRQGISGNLGLLYFSQPFAAFAQEILDRLMQRTGVSEWAGSCAHSVAVTGVEYQSEPALAVMLLDLPNDEFSVFSGVKRAPKLDAKTKGNHLAAFTALVHAHPYLPDLNELVSDMAGKTESAYLFGGVSGGSAEPFVQIANQVFDNGLSGVMFSNGVRMHSRLTQGCSPLANEHIISDASEQYLRIIDGRPALDVMLEDLGVAENVRDSRDGQTILRGLPGQRLRQGLMVGMARPNTKRGFGFGDLAVRHVVGIDPQNRVVALADKAVIGDRLVFCTRDEAAARKDLVRICAELKDEIDSLGERIRGAHWVSCVARSGLLFGGQQTELSIIQEQLGDVPLLGFYANGEIARDRLFGYTGVLTLFTEKLAD
jgi:small ligand-binding sensory domain FIST